METVTYIRDVFEEGSLELDSKSKYSRFSNKLMVEVRSEFNPLSDFIFTPYTENNDLVPYISINGDLHEKLIKELGLLDGPLKLHITFQEKGKTVAIYCTNGLNARKVLFDKYEFILLYFKHFQRPTCRSVPIRYKFIGSMKTANTETRTMDLIVDIATPIKYLNDPKEHLSNCGYTYMMPPKVTLLDFNKSSNIRI